MSVHFVKSVLVAFFWFLDRRWRRKKSKCEKQLCVVAMKIRICLAKKLGFPASTVHNVLKSFDTRLAIGRKARSGTKTDLRNHQKDAKVKQILQKRPDLSVGTVARKTKMSPTFVHTFKHRQDMKSFTVKTVPNRNDKQNVTARGLI